VVIQSRAQQGKTLREGERNIVFYTWPISILYGPQDGKEYVVRFCGSSLSTEDAYIKKQNKEGPQFYILGCTWEQWIVGKLLAILFDN
jgi:hypothetical protein